MNRSRNGRLVLAACALLIAVAVVRIAATYRVFNHTYDEGVHIAGGVEWLTHHTLTYFPYSRPLSRSAVALGPVLDGARWTGRSIVWLEGAQLLYARGRYWRTLTLARLGVLPFFIAATVLVAAWAYMLGGGVVAVVATAIFTNLPPVLAHAGLATADMAGTAGFLGVLVVLMIFARRSTALRAILVGVAVGAALTTKLTALPFAMVTAVGTLLVAVVLRNPALQQPAAAVRRSLPFVGIAALSSALLVWVAYGCAIGPIHGISYACPCDVARLARRVRRQNAMGHVSFLLGHVGIRGWRSFFPIALAVKTLLPALAFAGNLFGGGDLNFNRLIRGTIRSALKNERPIVRSDGSYVRDYLYVRDAVDAYLLLAERVPEQGFAGEAFNFGTETPLSVLQVVQAVLPATDRRSLEPDIRNEAVHEIPRQYLDCAKARTRLGWAPRWGFGAALSEGCRGTKSG